MAILAALFSSFLALTLVVVPLDDRPVTAQLPRLLGEIAGARVVEPPLAMLGNYLTPGDPLAILRWLRDDAPDANDYVVSNDMIVYGGLVASRIPGVSRGEAYGRLGTLAEFRQSHLGASFALFGTVMRLAPTGVPAIEGAASFPFAGEVWPKIQRYANLPDPPETDAQRAEAEQLRSELGSQLDSYLETRARDRDVDLYALRLQASGGFDRVVLGQDDAGPVGLHLRDLAALRSFAAEWIEPSRFSIEPGADELGMALVGAALAREGGIAPRVRVIYSTANGAEVHDPLEFAPIRVTIADLIRSCGGTEVDDAAQRADIDLFVKVPGTSASDETAFVDAIAARQRSGGVVAIADLSFLAANDYAQQRQLTEDLIARGIAGKIDAFASWNTTANTVGTALPEAIAVIVGRKLGTYDRLTHATFTLMRYVDDIAFHTDVRPQLNRELSKYGITDHTYLEPPVAQYAASLNRQLLGPDGEDLLEKILPQFRDAGFTATLPWNRTFETRLDVCLTPPCRSSRDF